MTDERLKEIETAITCWRGMGGGRPVEKRDKFGSEIFHPVEVCAELVAVVRKMKDALRYARCALESVQTDEQAQQHGLFQGPMIPRAIRTIDAAMRDTPPTESP